MPLLVERSPLSSSFAPVRARDVTLRGSVLSSSGSRYAALESEFAGYSPVWDVSDLTVPPTHSDAHAQCGFSFRNSVNKTGDRWNSLLIEKITMDTYFSARVIQAEFCPSSSRISMFRWFSGVRIDGVESVVATPNKVTSASGLYDVPVIAGRLLRLVQLFSAAGADEISASGAGRSVMDRLEQSLYGLERGSDHDIQSAIEIIHKLASSDEVEQLDKALLYLRYEECSVQMIVVLVRTLFSVRHQLKNWSSSIRRISHELSQKGRDPKKVLRGCLVA